RRPRSPPLRADLQTHHGAGPRARSRPVPCWAPMLTVARAFSLLLVLVTVACAGSAPSGRAPGGEAPSQSVSNGPKRIAIGIRGDPKTLSARLNSAAGAGGVPGVVETEELLNAGLAIEDSSNVFHAQLAE